MGKNTKVVGMEQHSDSQFISPKELMLRWDCARSTVDKITKRQGMSRMYLGEGTNGMVRLIRAEVEDFETKQTIRPHTQNGIKAKKTKLAESHPPRQIPGFNSDWDKLGGATNGDDKNINQIANDKIISDIQNPKEFYEIYFETSLDPNASVLVSWDIMMETYSATMGKVTAYGTTRKQAIEAVQEKIDRIYVLLQMAKFELEYDSDNEVYVAKIEGMLSSHGATSEQALKALAENMTMDE